MPELNLSAIGQRIAAAWVPTLEAFRAFGAAAAERLAQSTGDSDT